MFSIKRLITISTAILSINSMANSPIDLEGEYKFNNKMSVAVAYHVVPVFASSQAGQEEMRNLKEIGYTCSPAGRFYRCKNFIKKPLTELTKTKLKMKFAGTSIEISEPYANWQLSHESDFYNEYIMSQEISFQGTTFENYRYYENTEGLIKIQTGERTPADYGFVVKNEGHLQKMHEFTERQENGFFVYIVKLNFVK
jgi:hypothetical protein